MKKLYSILLAILAGAILILPPITGVTKIYADGGNLINRFTERVDYTTKVQDYYKTNPILTSYSSNLTCGIVAGGNIVSWYNKQYPSLIPGHNAGSTILGKWVWAPQNSYVDTMMSNLYTAMKASSDGVTINNYLTGMKSYATEKGRTFTSSKMMSGSSINFEAIKTALKNGNLLTIFVDGFSLCTLEGGPAIYTGYDSIPVEEYAGAHVLAVYGYMEIEYYNAQNTLFRKDTYLTVHSGFGGAHGSLRLNYFTTIDDCYITHIS